MAKNIEKFKNKYQLTSEQLKRTKMTTKTVDVSQKFLLEIEDGLIENISDWSLVEAFFLYEEDEDYICRYFQFSKGIKNHYVVLSHIPKIECISRKMDCKLMMDISKTLVDIIRS